MLALLVSVVVSAGQICVLDESSGLAQCVVESVIMAVHAEHAEDFDIQVSDFASFLNDVRRRGDVGTADVLVVSDGHFRRGQLGWWRGNGWHLAGLGMPIARLPPAMLPPVSMPPFDIPRPDGLPPGLDSVSSGLSVHEDGGINTDGQLLYGREIGINSYACNSYGTIDACKACCMATRTMAISGLAALAVKCHSVVAATFWGHIGCAVWEASVIGYFLYNCSKCNDNCLDFWWNDRSIDWSQYPQIQHDLSSGQYDTCEGWRRWVDWGGVQVIGLTTTWGGSSYECYVISEDGRINQELAYGDMYGVNVRLVGTMNPFGVMQPVDYRILDAMCWDDGRQIPYVGITHYDAATGLYIEKERGGRLYLERYNWTDNPDMADLKVWVYGDVTGDRIKVERLGILWFNW